MAVFGKESERIFDSAESWFRSILLTTQKSAIASAKASGFGDKNLADGLAVKSHEGTTECTPGQRTCGDGRGTKG